MATGAAHGGKRPGAGRKPVGPRCACGAMSLKRAIGKRHKCRVKA